MGTPFTPLLPPGKLDNPSFMNSPAEIAAATATGAQSQRQPVNSVIPKQLDPNSIEAQLKAEGSGTSWLTTAIAIAGAAKGDFRGLQAIEESKRRTSLAKSIIPHITEVNTMVNSGKWEEASSYVNKLVGSYGARADYLVPYFQQMQANIQKKQEGWSNIKAVLTTLEESGKIKEGHALYPFLQGIRKLAQDRTPTSESTLNNIATRYGGMHIQNINGVVYNTSNLTGETSIDILPQVAKGTDFDNFAGTTVATAHGLNTRKLADINNGVAVKTDSGTVITPGSEQAKTIIAAYNALQPINQEIEQAKLLPYEPAVLQQIAAKYGRLNAVRRAIPPDALNEAIYESTERDVIRQGRLKQQELDIDPRALQAMGRIAIYADPSQPNFLAERTEVTTPGDVKRSGGTIIAPRAEVVDKLIRPAQAAMQSVDKIPLMLEGITAATLGQRLTSGALQSLSSRFGFSLSANTTLLQHAKTILKTAIEQVENTPENVVTIRGGDREELRDLKAFAAGNFVTPQEVNRAAQTVKSRLGDIIKRAIALDPMPLTEQSETERLQRQPTKPKTPAGAIAPLIPPVQQRSQKGRGVPTPPPAMLDAEKQALEQARRNTTGGATTVTVPVPPGQGRAIPPPGATQPPPQGGEDEKAIIERMKREMKQKQRQGVR